MYLWVLLGQLFDLVPDLLSLLHFVFLSKGNNTKNFISQSESSHSQVTSLNDTIAAAIHQLPIIKTTIMNQCVSVCYFCFSALYCCVQSSNSFWFISMKSFRAL